MLTYTITKYVFLVLMIALIFTHRFVPIPAWVFVALLITFLLIVFYGSYYINSGFHIKAICKGNSAANEVALTFDDGPVEGNTNAILEILKRNNIQASFFCIGSRIQQNPGLVKRIDSEGHLIGNHSFTHHFFFDLFTGKRMISELADTNDEVRKVNGKTMTYFRPPYGVTTPVLAKVIRELGLNTIGWSVRSMDTVIKNPDKLVDKVTDRVKAGDIILLHDTSTVTVKALQLIIDNIHKKGLIFVRLDRLIKTNGYA